MKQPLRIELKMYGHLLMTWN